MSAEARVALTYGWRHGRWPSLRQPRRFTEWVQWRKLYDRDPNLAALTDKGHSKQMVAAMVGDAMTVPTYWEGTVLPLHSPWPMPFIVKANHGCNQYRVVWNDADYREVRRLAPHWLRQVYGAWLDEWHYRAARRQLIVEPYLGSETALPLDYKIYVFGGRAAIVQLHEGRGGDHRWSQYDLSWRPLSVGASAVLAPQSLDEMIAAAEQLSQGFDFLRVDFYELEGKPLFGEFCLYPGSGLDPFYPDSLDDWLGALWTAGRSVFPVRHSPERPARVTFGAAAPGHFPR